MERLSGNELFTLPMTFMGAPYGRCPCRKLYPAVLMKKSAEDRLSSELAEPLDRPMAR